MADQLILKGAAATLSVTLADQDGEPREAVGAVTVGVVDANGAEVVAAGTATTAGSDVGVHTYSLTPAQTADLAQFTVTWAEADGGEFETVIDVVGAYPFSIREARSKVEVFSDTIRYPHELLLEHRTLVLDEALAITGRSFVPRYRRMTADGTGSNTMRLPDSDITAVRSVKINGASISASLFKFTADGRLVLGLQTDEPYETDSDDGITFTSGINNIVVEYEYGMRTTPKDAREAMLARMRYIANRDASGLDERATTFSDGVQTFQLYTPGTRGAKTELPFVDGIYSKYTRVDREDKGASWAGTVAFL